MGWRIVSWFFAFAGRVTFVVGFFPFAVAAWLWWILSGREWYESMRWFERWLTDGD